MKKLLIILPLILCSSFAFAQKNLPQGSDCTTNLDCGDGLKCVCALSDGKPCKKNQLGKDIKDRCCKKNKQEGIWNCDSKSTAVIDSTSTRIIIVPVQ